MTSAPHADHSVSALGTSVVRRNEDAQAQSARERTSIQRHAYRRLALSMCLLLVLTAALPITDATHRLGILLTALSLLGLVIVWFWLVPPDAFGERRVLVFGLLAQPVAVVSLSLTGGLRSPYFAFTLLLVTVTVFSPTVWHTIIVGTAIAVSLFVVALVAPGLRTTSPIAALGTWMLLTAAASLVAAHIGQALRASRAASAARAEELRALRAQAETLALTDTLTGLYNRRFAAAALDRLIAEARRGRAFSVVVLDLDKFKRVNDDLGHAAGDAVLVDFARLLRAELRGADIAVRTGGDEFLVLMPGTTAAQAALTADRLRDAMREARWGLPGTIATVSCGVAEWSEGQSADELLTSADRFLYEAKAARVA